LSRPVSLHIRLEHNKLDAMPFLQRALTQVLEQMEQMSLQERPHIGISRTISNRIGRRQALSDAESQDMRVLCFGDSNTAGFCSNGRRFEPYGRSLSQALSASGVPCVVDHCGLNGLTSQEMAIKLHDPAIRDVCGHVHKGLGLQIEKGRPTLVIIMTGTNDFAKGVSPERVLENVKMLHSACHNQGIPTIALAPPTALRGTPRVARDRFAELLGNWAHSATNVTAFYDVEDLIPRVPGGSHWEPDEIHLSPAGSRELGQRLMHLVLSSPKEKTSSALKRLRRRASM